MTKEKYEDPLDAYAEVKIVDLEPIEDGLGTADASVRKAGQRVKDSVPQGKGNSIDKVQEFVSKRLHETSKAYPLPPYDAISRDERFVTMLEDCLQVVERYRMHGFDANAGNVTRDLMHLHGNLIYLSGMVGYLKASVDHAASSRKHRRSDAYLAAKAGRDALGAMVTDADATSIARTESKEFDNSRNHLNLLASTLTTTYYAIRSFAEELGRIAQRNDAAERRAIPHA